MPEKRIVLKNCGVIDPYDISSHLDRDGFKAFDKVRKKMTAQEVIEEVIGSGLRGRGGAGFPCGLKWELAKKTGSDQKFIICNADEGEVGAFKDRYILEKDPFTLIEGIAIAGCALGARQAYIYLRQEYHYLLDRIENAITQAVEHGFLDLMKIDIIEGAGAYICGEESALMESVEGKRGEPRYRPPFPPNKGLFGKPTIINNVETLMNIPQIILNGGDWFNGIGKKGNSGTKVFSVSGDIERPGVYELILGSELRELVVDLARGNNIQAVQVGGAAGKLIPGNMLKTLLVYETALGSGAVTVFDQSRDIIGMVYQTLRFLAEESCGKCTPCRDGIKIMSETLERIVNGEGAAGDINVLEDLSEMMRLSSLCGLGQSAPVPVLDSLKYFGSEYETRISQSIFLRSLKGIRG